MIFLAVILGFLAENLRESISNNSHVTELTQQLREDLVTDTMNIRRLIDQGTIQIRRTDSLFDALTQKQTAINQIEIQRLLVSCDHIDIFFQSAGAITTIKNELHLRRFVRSRISSYITNYEKDAAVLHTFENRDIDYMGKYLETFMSRHFTPANAAAAVDHLAFRDSTMRNINTSDYEQLSVDINLVKAYNKQLVIWYSNVRKDAIAFIDYIDRTY
jgi:hypothetical protein